LRQPVPLNLFRTFEIAARHLSFKKAAQELFVTQGAVSQQIKTLEDYLGVALFRRMTRAIELTDNGQALLPYARDALEQLTEGMRAIERRSCAGILTISVLPSFASTWLMPRLCKFRVLHPEIEVHFSATERKVDFHREPVDGAIRYGNGKWPNLNADYLLAAGRKPVCSPELLTGAKPLNRPEDLLHHTLLHTTSKIDDWRMWLRAAGIDSIDPMRGLRFESAALTLQAAANGLGVAIGRRALAINDLSVGRLIEPFDFELLNDWAYYFVTPSWRHSQKKIQLFRRWLLDEAGHPTKDCSLADEADEDFGQTRSHKILERTSYIQHRDQPSSD